MLNHKIEPPHLPPSCQFKGEQQVILVVIMGISSAKLFKALFSFLFGSPASFHSLFSFRLEIKLVFSPDVTSRTRF